MASGVERTNVIDMIAHDPATDEVALIIIETRPWSGAQKQLFQLQEKINAYLSFALDGEMADCHPDLAAKRLLLRIDCIEYPDPATVEFLQVVRDQIAFQGIRLEVLVKSQGCGDHCSCEDSA